uniref:Uncharacterized protein n=1 Tax=Arundo donax TaxID=35708 RepID=A0A0A9DWI3_ARUDO
MVSQQLQWT